MKHNLRILFLVLTLLGLPVKLLWGQRSLDQRVIGRAVSGEPYGICVVEIPVPNPVSGRVELPLAVRENQGSNNILFPISHDLVIEVAPPSQRQLPQAGGGRLLERVGELFKELSGDESMRLQTVSRRVFFLFRGDEPLRIQIADERRDFGQITLNPEINHPLHTDLMNQWWEGYALQMQSQIESADYPTLVESYLLATLARQNQLKLPSWFIEATSVEEDLVDPLKLIGGVEEVSDTIFKLAARGVDNHSSVRRMKLPDSPKWKPAQDSIRDDSDVSIEPLAYRVPSECFYIRYGSFSNYLWFKDLSEANGGDLSKLVTLRGVERNVSGRVEKQLAFRMTQLSRILGGTLVKDQALIGRDLYLNDGAALGVLFHATNTTVLRASIQAERRKIASEDDEVTLEDIEIDGQSVSLLSHPGGEVRSFLAVDGDYMLVTNSRHLIKRFYEVTRTGETLASTPAFRQARRYMPLAREDTVFAYFSPEMFQGLISPKYMIELRRRLFAKADLVMVQLSRLLLKKEQSGETEVSNDARLDADSESFLSIDELIKQRFLPARFGDRFDRSGVFQVGNRLVDTLRGARGTFIPICDVDVQDVTPEEAEWYEKIATGYLSRFANFDPVMVGVQRKSLDEASDQQQIVIHAEIAPWDPGKYGELANQLGPPTRTVMRFAPDDIVSVQGHVASDWLGPPTHLFAAIKDTNPPDPSRFSGVLRTYFSIKQIPGYLGAWPQPGALDRLPLGLGRGRPIGPGMTKLVGGLYRYNDGQFSVVSFHPDVLQESLPHLAAMDSETTAQARLRIGDLGGSQLRDWVNEQLYQRASESSLSGARYYDLLSRNLPIKAEDAPEVARMILDAKLQCTLGGEYQISPEDSSTWVSSVWGGERPPEDVPNNYQAPFLRWFHGVNARVTQLDQRLVVDLTLNLQ